MHNTLTNTAVARADYTEYGGMLPDLLEPDVFEIVLVSMSYKLHYAF